MTKKSAQMRMGKGKGKLQKFVANVFSGSTIFELEHSKSDI